MARQGLLICGLGALLILAPAGCGGASRDRTGSSDDAGGSSTATGDAASGAGGSSGEGDAGQSCFSSCPVATATADIGVTTPSAAIVDGVTAVLTGPTSVTLVCQPNPPVSSVVCLWPGGVAFVSGTYSLQVAAPGYETATIQVEITAAPQVPCGCSFDSIVPSTVSIVPTDGSGGSP